MSRIDDSVRLFFFKIFSGFITYLELLFITEISLYDYLSLFFSLMYAYYGQSSIRDTRVDMQECLMAWTQADKTSKHEFFTILWAYKVKTLKSQLLKKP